MVNYPLRVGDLLTDTSVYDTDIKVKARLLTVADLFRLALGRVLEDPAYILDVVQDCVDINIYSLTDNDLLYIMAWLRLHSYPKSPIITEWRCYNEIEWEGKIQTCNRLNTQTIHNPKLKIQTLEDYTPDDILTLPTVSTYLDVFYTDKEESLMMENARYIKEGKTLKEKLDILKDMDLGIVKRIHDFKQANSYGIYEVLELKCLQCGYSTPYTITPDILTFFPNHSEESILNIQYSLMLAFGIAPDNSMLAKQLLYLYSSYIKDKQELEQLERMKAATGKSGTFKTLGS